MGAPALGMLLVSHGSQCIPCPPHLADKSCNEGDAGRPVIVFPHPAPISMVCLRWIAFNIAVPLSVTTVKLIHKCGRGSRRKTYGPQRMLTNSVQCFYEASFPSGAVNSALLKTLLPHRITYLDPRHTKRNSEK